MRFPVLSSSSSSFNSIYNKNDNEVEPDKYITRDSGNEGDSEREFEVERILDKRIKSITGKTEYRIKFKGYNNSYNRWLPKENLNCDELIEDFEGILNNPDSASTSTSKHRSKRLKRSRLMKKSNSAVDKTENLIPDSIVGATAKNGFLEFYVKWSNCEEISRLNAKEVNHKWPQMVIRFYENKIKWKD